MSKASKKPYVIRGFNRGAEPTFDCTGVITKFASFDEVTADKQHDAVVEMTTHSSLRTMSTRNLIATNPNAISAKADATKELYVVDLVLVTTADHNDGEIRQHKTAIREIIKTWAEKSRVTGRRGWRLNAIKTPSFEYDKKEDAVVIRTQVILSTAIFYNDHTSTINFNFNMAMEQEDLRSLHRAMRTVGVYSHLKYKHSVIGEGEVI